MATANDTEKAPDEASPSDPSSSPFTESVSAESRRAATLAKNIQLDQVIAAQFVGPSSFFLRFADGFAGTWSFHDLQLDLTTVNPETVRVCQAGAAIEMESAGGETVQLDSSSLRYLVDPEYAAKVDDEIAALTIPSGRLERIAQTHQPPQEWYDSQDEQG